MHEPTGSGIKAWAPDYPERAFCFEQKFEALTRLVAWSADAAQIQRAFFTTVDLLPDPVEVLLKVEAGRSADGEPLWARYAGVRRREALLAGVRANEFYVFSDGAHQLTLKDPAREHYLTLDEHGIFFLYAPTSANREVFRAAGFTETEAPLIYNAPHFHRVAPDTRLQGQFIQSLGLLRTTAAAT
jgi:hypothetical protein